MRDQAVRTNLLLAPRHLRLLDPDLPTTTISVTPPTLTLDRANAQPR